MLRLKEGLLPAIGKGVLEVGTRWWNHNHSRSAAALAFFSLFSMVPILMVVTQLAAAVIGKERAEEEMSGAAEMVFDEDAADYLRELLSAQPGAAFTGISSVIGFFVLLFTASRVVVELREVLTTVFGERVREGKKGMVIKLVLGRLVPVLLVLALGLVLALSAFVAAALKVVTTQVDGWLPMNLQLWEWGQRVLPLVSVAFLFALILRWLPPRPPAFRDALVGGMVAGGLMAMLRGLIGFYFGQSSVATAYGAAVTLVVLLLWIYFVIQVFFIGAETTAHLTRLREGKGKEAPGDP